MIGDMSHKKPSFLLRPPFRELEYIGCNSDHPYRLLPPSNQPPVLEVHVAALSHDLLDGVACLAGQDEDKLTGLVELLEAALISRLGLTQRFLDDVTHYYIHRCP